MTAETIADLARLEALATPGPWDWLVHDHSMASLGVMPDPGMGTPLVLAVSPCKGCQGRAEPKEWKWGRCCTPKEADANLIVAARNALPSLLDALRQAEKALEYYSDWDSGPVAKNALSAIQKAANPTAGEA